jgi:hypothetical protein
MKIKINPISCFTAGRQQKDKVLGPYKSELQTMTDF